MYMLNAPTHFGTPIDTHTLILPSYMYSSTVPSDVCDEEEEEGEEEQEESEESEEENESDLEGMAPTPKRRKLAREKTLKVSLQSGWYPTFRGIEGPSCDMDPVNSSAMDCL